MPVTIYERNPERIQAYEIGIRKNSVPRIDWQSILGCSLTRFVFLNRYLEDEDLVNLIMNKCGMNRNNIAISDWKWEDIEKNLRTSISARRAEQKSYLR
jgi:hypothetical protein